jgi:hypothetical protein
MGFFDIFRRAPAIREAGALADFIDENAAFLIQKGMYEYSRARAGHYAKVLLQEPEFLAAIETLGLALVGEMVEGVLHDAISEDRRAGLDRLIALVLSVFDRYPVPPSIGTVAWEEARSTLRRRLDQVGLHAPKFVKDIPGPLADTYFDLMPIHEKLRAADRLAITSYLRISLINIHDALIKRIDVPAVAQSLLAAPPDTRG